MALVFAALLGGCSAVGRTDVLPAARLYTLAGDLAAPLNTCPTERCVTIAVAPWCSVCRAHAEDIKAFRRYLDERSIQSRVVVGSSKDRVAIAAFALEFGSETQLDPVGALKIPSVPHLILSDREGRVLKRLLGIPAPSSKPTDFAKMLGLI
jgi:hypothetical protein